MGAGQHPLHQHSCSTSSLIAPHPLQVPGKIEFPQGMLTLLLPVLRGKAQMCHQSPYKTLQAAMWIAPAMECCVSGPFFDFQSDVFKK